VYIFISIYIYIYKYIYIPLINTTNRIIALNTLNNYIFRPLTGHHQAVQNLRGDYIQGVAHCLGDEISSYNIVHGVKAGCRHIVSVI